MNKLIEKQVMVFSTKFYNENKDKYSNSSDLLKAKVEYLTGLGLIKNVSYPSIKKVA